MWFWRNFQSIIFTSWLNDRYPWMFRYELFSQFLWKFLKQCCNPEKACNFIFSTETLSKYVTFRNNRKSKSRLDKKLCQFSFFTVRHFLDKLSKLGKNSCVIHYYRNKRPLISVKVFRQSSWKLVQNEKDYTLTLRC